MKATFWLTRHIAQPLTLITAANLNALTLIWLVITVWLGRAWDGYWHATYTFDSFFSPPHVFVYVMTALNFVPLAALLAFPTSARLLHLSAALSLGWVVFAGLVLDNAWHTRFGLDETLWSTPHAALGWAWWLTLLCLTAAQFQLTPQMPLLIQAMLGVGLISFSIRPMLGPLAHYATPELTRFMATLPIYTFQPEVQHTYQLYLSWNLTRANPWLLPLGALWAGFLLALLWRFSLRAWVVILSVAAWSAVEAWSGWQTAQLFDLTANPANWLPVPLLPAALVGAWLNGHRWRWPAVGLAFAICASWVWGASLWWWPLAALCAGVGAQLGQRVAHTLITPTCATLTRLLLTGGLLLPFILGLLDLYWRFFRHVQ